MAENYIGMSRLHFLLLDGHNVKGDYSTWSQELSWLQWMDSDLSALPLEHFTFCNVGLQIPYKDVRTLILSNCIALKELPKDIGKLLSFNELNLLEFKNIIRLHVSTKGTQTHGSIRLCQVGVFT